MSIIIFLVAIFLVASLTIIVIYRNKDKKILSINGVMLSTEELEKYAHMLSSKHVITYKSSIKTYPANIVKENFKFISKVFNMLNSHIDMGINADPSRGMVTRQLLHY